VLADKLIDKSSIKYYGDKPGFTVSGKMAKDDASAADGLIKGKIVPLMVEISHQ